MYEIIFIAQRNYFIFRGALCSGATMLGSSSWRPDIPISSRERNIVDRELRLGLSNLRYEHYERIIKRYGYKGRIEESVIEEIGSEVHLKLSDLDNNDKL